MATRVWAAALNATLLPLSVSPRTTRSALSTLPSGGRLLRLRSRRPRPAKVVCRRAKNAGFEDYMFPDPIPEFAEQEMSRFREHMTWWLEQKKEYFGEHVEEIVDVCTEARIHFAKFTCSHRSILLATSPTATSGLDRGPPFFGLACSRTSWTSFYKYTEEGNRTVWLGTGWLRPPLLMSPLHSCSSSPL